MLARHISLKNEIHEVTTLNGFVTRLCSSLNCDTSVTAGINLALEEAVVNIINYAYPPGTKGYIRIDAQAESDVLTITVKDGGRPFDPTAAPMPNTSLPAEVRQIGGLGIYLIRRYMDGMHYQRRDGHNILTLTKNLKHHENID